MLIVEVTLLLPQGTPSAEDKEKQMRERLATMTKNLTETSHQADAMKQENKLLSKVRNLLVS